MHELSMAATLVDSVLEFAVAHEVKKVLRVRLLVGELTHLEPEQLRFCYTSITTDTTMEGSMLEIETVQAQVHCPHCSYQGPPKYWEEALSQVAVATLQCPQCGRAVDATQGQECAIKTVQYVA